MKTSENEAGSKLHKSSIIQSGFAFRRGALYLAPFHWLFHFKLACPRNLLWPFQLKEVLLQTQSCVTGVMEKGQ